MCLCAGQLMLLVEISHDKLACSRPVCVGPILLSTTPPLLPPSYPSPPLPSPPLLLTPPLPPLLPTPSPSYPSPPSPPLPPLPSPPLPSDVLMESEMDRLKELAGPIVRDHMSHSVCVLVLCTAAWLCPVDQFVCAIGMAGPLNYVRLL